MKVCVAGLGAVGGLVAARLALAGHEVSALARGATLAAVQERGLALTAADRGRRVARIRAAPTATDLPVPELLIVAFKGQALAADAPSLAPLIGPQTLVLPMMNGVPWWFLQPHDAKPLASVDLHGRIAATIPLPQTLGAVVHLTCVSTAPGEVRHGFGERLIVGEPGGGICGHISERAHRVCAALADAGFQAEASSDIRRDLWFKLWGNMTTNPVSALTGAACDAILDDELVSAFMARGMAEAAAIGARIGCPIEQTPEARMAVTRQLGAFRTSMLVDAEAGRALELDALVGAVREIGARVGVATPNIDALHGLARLMDRTNRIRRATD